MISAHKLLPRLKNELRVSDTADDVRLMNMIGEAVDYLQLFKAKTLVDTVTIATTETTLTPLDHRFIFLYCAMQYDGDGKLQAALDQLLTLVRA